MSVTPFEFNMNGVPCRATTIRPGETAEVQMDLRREGDTVRFRFTGTELYEERVTEGDVERLVWADGAWTIGIFTETVGLRFGNSL